MQTKHPTQPAPFLFTPENLLLAEKSIRQYPESRQASAVLSLLDLAQRQNGGWLSPGAMAYVANMLKMPEIRVYEVATFYTMFNLSPVGQHFLQVCTTTPCALRGSGELMEVCHRKLGIKKGQTTADGLFSVTEVECLGACVNAPIVQINDDYFEDLDAESFSTLLDDLAAGREVTCGSVKGRQGSKPLEDPKNKSTGCISFGSNDLEKKPSNKTKEGQ